jgi:hypothetical protein
MAQKQRSGQYQQSLFRILPDLTQEKAQWQLGYEEREKAKALLPGPTEPTVAVAVA